MSTGTLRIRPAKMGDLPQVNDFTSNTFSWGDYLPQVWDRWVRTSRGELLVAEIDKQVVGTINVRYLEHREAWLEAVRVRHEFRRRGVAGLMVQAAHECAKQSKCRVIRLETGLHNTAAQRVFEKYGYRRVAHYDTYKVDAEAGSPHEVRLAKSADLKTCWDLWQASQLKRATQAIVPSPYGWRWWELTRKRLAHEIREKRVWMADKAFMLTHPEDDDNDLDVKLVVGGKRSVVKLLGAARAMAAQNNNKQVFWIAPHNARVRNLAAAANFILDDDDLLIYARPL